MNETPMYLVPGRLTDEQRRDFFVNMSWDVDGPEGAEDMIDAIGTLIHPIKDVENAGYRYDYKRDLGHFGEERWFTLCSVTLPPDSEMYKNITSLVRRTDMEAQVARVAAKKDAEIARLRRALSRVGDALAYEINEHSIVDTVWISPIETMDDFIEAALTEGSAE
ncbi:hypothetical protein [Komagataeibacter oboediens]|uniref:hypothetical protein n=1 Tax=Komagataeibacter oboediens TaxID=65958 RepID=UPI001E420D8B|nr:hypothetical protein [Komagataeibacter oboediens]